MDVNFDLALINEVKKYTMLYNVNAKGYMNCEKKGRLWKTIAKSLQSTVRICYKRWQTMRHCYRQNVERAKTTGRVPTWVYFKLLKFLDNYPNPKQIKIFENNKPNGNETENNVMDEDNVCCRLIEEVKRHEMIYDKKSPNYYNALARAETWSEIAKNLEQSDNDCKEKWRSFRDIYIKIRKRELSSNDHSKFSSNRNKQWKYYDKMHFLKNYISFKTNSKPMNLSEGLKNCTETVKSEELSAEESEHLSSDIPIEKEICKKRTFSKLDNLKLIELVKQEEILYVRKWAGLSNIFRQQKWNNIALELNTDGQTCRERWRRLRDQYIKLKKSWRNPDDLTWVYFESLTFLNDHISSKKPTIETIAIKPEDENESADEFLYDNKATPLECYTKPNEDENLENEHNKMDDDDEFCINANAIIIYEPDTLDNTESQMDMDNEHLEISYERVLVTVNSTDNNDAVDGFSNAVNDAIDNDNINDIFENMNTNDNGNDDANDVADSDDEDEPVLYLQSNGEGTENISSDSSLTISSSKKPKDESNLFKNLAEFLQKPRQACFACQERLHTQKDSINLLFQSLALSIKNSQLAESDMLELQADIHSYVTQRLVEYNKRNNKH